MTTPRRGFTGTRSLTQFTPLGSSLNGSAASRQTEQRADTVVLVDEGILLDELEKFAALPCSRPRQRTAA
jgi:hypothetical protein